MKRPAVFFDRDGVINHDHGYAFRPSDIEWMDGAAEAIRYFNHEGRKVMIITNQSGIARGYYTEADVLQLHEWMNQELATKGAHIDGFYYCPHHPEGNVAKFCVSCDCRKPEPGMILKAIAEWDIDAQASFMVGDRESDITAASAAGLSGYLFAGGNLYEFLQKIHRIG